MPSETASKRPPLLGALYGLALAALLGGAAAVRLSLPQTPIIDPDYGGYLWPALSELTGHGFTHVEGRNSLYPAFVFVILKLLGNFRAISVVQHLLGLVTGGLMVAACQRGLFLLRYPSHSLSRLPPLLSLLPAAAYLSAPTAILFEQSVRPEAIFPLVVMLSICLNLEFTRYRWVTPAAAAAAWLGAGQLIVSVLAYQLKPSFGFAVIFVNLPMLASLPAGGVSARSKILMTAGGGAFCALFLVWPESMLARTDPRASTFLPDTLLTVHADQVRAQLAEDLAVNRPGPYPRPIETALLARLDATLPIARRVLHQPYPTLGFNPDYLFYIDNVYKGVFDPEKNTYRERSALGFYLYERTFLHHPLRMLAEIGRQLRVFYHFGAAGRAPIFNRGFRLPLEPMLQPYANLFFHSHARRLFREYAPATAFVEDSRALARTPAEIGQAPILTSLQRTLEWLYLPGLLATLFISGWAAATGRLGAGWLLPVTVTLLLFSYNFGNNLTIATVHSLDVERYVTNQLAYTLLASFFGLALIGETLRRFTSALAAASPGGRHPDSWLPAAISRGSGGENSPPTLGILILDTSGQAGASELATEYRTQFPAARLAVMEQGSVDGFDGPGSSRAMVTALAELDSDAIILADGSRGYPMEGGRLLWEAYCGEPADLISGIRGQPAPNPCSRLIGLLCGWHPRDLSGGLLLVSRRFHENVPILSRGFPLGLELTLQAIANGFAIREVPVPCAAPDPVAPADGTRGWEGRLVWRLLFVLARDFRPLLSGGILAGACWLLSLWPALALTHAVRHSEHAPWGQWLAATLWVAGLLTLQTGVVLESTLRRQREATQLRIRDWLRRAAASK